MPHWDENFVGTSRSFGVKIGGLCKNCVGEQKTMENRKRLCYHIERYLLRRLCRDYT